MFSLSAQTCPSDHKSTDGPDMEIIIPKTKKKKEKKKEHYVQTAVNIKKKIDKDYFLHIKQMPHQRIS